MAKPEKRAEARRLRAQGLSLKEICERIGCSKSSVSVWVRDIELTPEQQAELHKRHSSSYTGQVAGAEANKRKGLEQRLAYQEEGREQARKRDWLHSAGCALYWGEGSKKRTSVGLTNSDAVMLVFFKRFLDTYFNVSKDRYRLEINVYLGNGLTLEEIIDYWLKTLDLPYESLTKPQINNQPMSSKQKGRKLIYGTCSLRVHRTDIVQHIYGAIQEYSGVDNPNWLM